MDIAYIKFSSLDLASALHCLGFPIDGIDFNQQTAIFLFKKEDAVEEAIQKFGRHELRVDPLELLRIRKEIMARIKDEKYAQGS